MPEKSTVIRTVLGDVPSEQAGITLAHEHILYAYPEFFPETMSIPYYWRRQTVEELTGFFVTDLTEGMIFQSHQTAIRADAIKIATGGEGVAVEPSPVGPNGRRITTIEDRIIRAAHAAQAVGCAINTHTNPNDYAVTNPGLEQLDILAVTAPTSSTGCWPSRWPNWSGAATATGSRCPTTAGSSTRGPRSPSSTRSS